MKKYLFIFKSELMSNLQYAFNTFVGFIGYTIMLFILFNLYRYLYSDPSEVINGYTMNQMVWYVIFTEVLWSISNSKNLTEKISEDVRGGNIAYNVSKPYSYIGYIIASHLGGTFIKTLVYTILALGLGFLLLGVFPSISFLEILAVILVAFIANFIGTLLTICVGLLSFKIEDASPVYWVYSKLILVFGTIFPIEYFPTYLQPILSYSPIYVTTYGPARLFVNFSTEAFMNILMFQLIYLVIAYLLCLLMYKKGVKNLNVNGG